MVGTPGSHCASVQILGSWLAPGRYYIELGIWSSGGGHHQHISRAIAFDIIDANVDSVGEEALRPMLSWNVN